MIVPIAALLLASTMPVNPPQRCFPIHARAVWYRGDGFFAIWHIGTHHIFMPADDQSYKLLCGYFDCKNGEVQPALFADFTVCPTEPFVEGAAQNARVVRVRHPFVVADWPSEKK